MSQFIVDFKDSVAKADIDLYLGSISATIVKTFNAFKNAYVIESPAHPASSDLVENIINDDETHVKLLGEIVNMNFSALAIPARVKTLTTSDPKQWWKLYSMYGVDFAKTSINLPIRGKGVSIYLVDSGIKRDHIEFANSDIVDLFSICADYEDRTGHGTALASVMVGETCGITNATVKNVKLFDSQVPTKQSDMLSAFDAIFNDFMVTTTNLGIVNCSWVIARNSYIEAKMKILQEAGMFIIAAAGNNGTAIENVTPAAMPNVIVVGAYNSDFLPCDFSNYSDSAISITNGPSNLGRKLTGWAPGQDIWCATINGEYGNSSGTSVAAAIHTAIATHQLSEMIVDGEFPKCFTVVPLRPGMYLFFGKRGMLDLTGEQYSNSINEVSILPIVDFHSMFNIDSTHDDQRINARLNANVRKRIINPAKVKFAEIVTDLPNGIKLNSLGVLYGKVGPINAPYLIQNSKIKITKNDDSTTEFDVQFVIKSDNIDPSTVTESDPEIRYLLTTAYSCAAAYIEIPSGSTCINDCGGVTCLFQPENPYAEPPTPNIYGTLQCIYYYESKTLDWCFCGCFDYTIPFPLTPFP